MAYSPILGNPKPQYFDSNGDPYVGMRLFFYAAGTSTKQDTQTDSTGGTDNTNPIVIDADGFPTGNVMIYGANNLGYKVVAALPGTDDPPAAPLWTIDNVYPGVTVNGQWINPYPAVYTNATTFTIVGVDVTSTFHVGRRVKCTGGADIYGTISASSFSTNTTVTVVVDAGGTLNAGMDTAYIGINSANSTSSGITFYPTQSWETGVVDNTYRWLNASRYGCKGDNGVTDNSPFLANLWASANSNQELIPNNTAINQIHGAVVDFEPGNYYVATKTSIPSRTRVNGNNASIFTDQAITMLDVYGFETVISQMRFYKGTIALNFTQGNTDTSVNQIHDCYFESQTSKSIQSLGTFSTHLNITDCKFRVIAQIIDTECDETSISGGWVTALTTGVAYFKSTGHLSMDNILMVPSGITDATTTHWIQLGDSGNLVGNLSCRRVRFGGEAVMGYLKSYAQAYSILNGIKRTINIENCELFGSGGFDLVEIPNTFILRGNHYSTSGVPKINTLGANAIVATSNIDGFILDDDRALWDNATNAYLYGNPSNQGDGKNQIATNASFTGFGLASALAGGTITSTADVFPTNSIRVVTTGVKTVEPQLYISYAFTSSGLTGIYTFQVYVKADTDLSITLTIGTRQKRFPIEGNDTFQIIRLPGLLTAAADSIVAACFDMPDNATLTFGHPLVLKGNVVTDVLLQAPSSTTSVIDLINGKYYTSAIPVDGFWNKGCVLYDLTPAVGAIGWVCTVSGAPGTWVIF